MFEPDDVYPLDDPDKDGALELDFAPDTLPHPGMTEFESKLLFSFLDTFSFLNEDAQRGREFFLSDLNTLLDKYLGVKSSQELSALLAKYERRRLKALDEFGMDPEEYNGPIDIWEALFTEQFRENNVALMKKLTPYWNSLVQLVVYRLAFGKKTVKLVQKVHRSEHPGLFDLLKTKASVDALIMSVQIQITMPVYPTAGKVRVTIAFNDTAASWRREPTSEDLAWIYNDIIPFARFKPKFSSDTRKSILIFSEKFKYNMRLEREDAIIKDIDTQENKLLERYYQLVGYFVLHGFVPSLAVGKKKESGPYLRSKLLCFECGEKESQVACAVCREAHYCTKECARRNWGVHEAICASKLSLMEKSH
jgi:hypothetical protein